LRLEGIESERVSCPTLGPVLQYYVFSRKPGENGGDGQRGKSKSDEVIATKKRKKEVKEIIGTERG